MSGKLSGGHQAAVMCMAVGKLSNEEDLVITGSKDHYIKVYAFLRRVVYFAYACCLYNKIMKGMAYFNFINNFFSIINIIFVIMFHFFLFHKFSI